MNFKFKCLGPVLSAVIKGKLISVCAAEESSIFAFSAASAIPKRIKASASIHGVKLLTGKDDSPHLNASLIKAEMYFAMAEKDKWADPKMVDELDEHLKDWHQLQD